MFRNILACVAGKTTLVLERKALPASSLAITYPASAAAFRRIESAASEQLLTILAAAPWDSNLSLGGDS